MMRRAENADTDAPFFSVGVTTYKRKELLLQTLSSLVGQTFKDFEILIGNDYPDEILSPEYLGIEDSRVRIFNNEKNMGELDNMNSLLSKARGRYFTWQFDDDPCSSILLSEIYSTLVKNHFPLAVFTSFSYIYGTTPYQFGKTGNGPVQLLSGRDFLRKYLSGSLRALGCCGFYDIEYLKELGGVQRLSDGAMALHSEYLLLIKGGLLTSVAYIPAPLVSTRVHNQSWTCSNNDLALFKQAGRNLIRESVTILSTAELKDDFKDNFSSVLRAVLSSVIVKSIMQNKHLDANQMREYVGAIRGEFDPLKGSELFNHAMASLDAAYKKMPWDIMKAKVKSVTPVECWKYLHIARSLVARYRNKAF
jgi:hypothetical protein